MINPGEFNKIKVQLWSDKFWKMTLMIWMPFMILYKVIHARFFDKESKW